MDCGEKGVNISAEGAISIDDLDRSQGSRILLLEKSMTFQMEESCSA